MVAKERHDIGRPNDAGYPVRAIRTREFLYVQTTNQTAGRQAIRDRVNRTPRHGPTKQLIVSSYDNFFSMSFGKRPPEELYLIAEDPQCIKNVATDRKYAQVMRKLRDRMEETLLGEGDPRMLGRADFFDTIQYTGPRKHSYENWLKYSKSGQ